MEEKLKKNKANRPDDLLRFYKSYFMDYWEVKYKFLKYEIDNFEIQKQRLAEISGNDVTPNYKKKYLSMLKLDLHFMKFQIIESLFSFIFALENRDDKFIWFNLTFPRYEGDLRNYPYERISKLSYYGRMKNYLISKRNDDLNPLWKHLFFFNIDISQYDKDFNSICNNIGDLLIQLAQQLKDRDDYNAYKHSLRCIPFSNSYISFSTNFKNWVSAGFAKNILNTLDSDEKNGDVWINVVSKSYSIIEDSFYIEKCLELMKNIINTRISQFFNEELEELYFFDNIEKEFHNEYTIISQSRSIISINSLYSLGCQAMQNGDFKLAEFYFEKIFQVDDKHYDSMFHLGYCHYCLEEYNTAIKYCKNYEKNGQAKYYIENLYNLALSYYKNGNFEKADVFFGKFIRKCEEEIDLELIEDRRFIEAKYLRVDSKLKLNQNYFDKHKSNDTNKYINPAEDILSTIDDSNFQYPKIWYSIAFIEMNLKRYDKSKEKFKKIINHHPDNIESINHLARIYYIEEKYPKAEKLLQNALKINKENFYIWNGISVLKRKQGNQEGFYEACINTLKYSNNDEQRKIAFNNLGDYYHFIEDYEKASEFFKKSLGIDKSFGNAISGFIDNLWKLKNYKGIIQFTEDLDNTPNNALNLKFRAYSYSEIGEFDKALQIIDRLIPIIKNDNMLLTDFYDTKGDIYRKMDDLEKAMEFYQIALDQSEIEHSFLAQTKQKLKECRTRFNKSV